MLKIENLQVTIATGQLQVIKEISLDMLPGSVHALMGKNGSGKSSLAYTLMGHPNYIASGTVLLNGQNILNLSPDKRAKLGIFLAFQHPLELPGVTVFNFLKESYQAVTGALLSVSEFQKFLVAVMEQLNIDPSFANRSLNDGFSGGEKKRLELLQLLILKPKLAILDEIDSGLDISALKMVGTVLNKLKIDNPSMSLLIITHYQRILDYIHPDFVHIMEAGTIVQSGNAHLAKNIENKGYSVSHI